MQIAESVIKLSSEMFCHNDTKNVICHSCAVEIFNSGIELKCWEVWPPIFPFFWKGRLPEKDWLIVPFQKLNSFLFCNFTRLCLSIGMIPAFDLYSLIVPLTTHQPNQPSWNFWGEIPSKIWRFRNSTPGFFEPVRDCSFITQYKFGVPRDPSHPICNIVINWDDPPPPLPPHM